jgi:glycerol-3-phosphate dehydrogenase
MKRDTSILAKKSFEVIVVGGGIHGATIFYQLAAAGVHVALVEKEDFGGGTSANSLKILHGGLRYLQHLNIKRMRESINSRKYYMQMAPHLLQPLPCVVPTFGLGMKGRPIMAIALQIFDLIGWDRNKHTPAENRVGRGHLLTRNQCLKIGRGIPSDGLTGGAVWYDDLITNTERMALTFIKEGCRRGGVAANYVKVRKFSRLKNRITGAEVTDSLSGRTFTIKADLAINAAGPWANDIRQESHQASTTEDLAKAVNILIKKPLFPNYGVGLESSEDFTDNDAKIKRSKRLFFFVPWKKQTIIGTTYTYYSGKCDELHVDSDDIQEILDEVNTIYPTAKLGLEDVVFAHAGLMPAHTPASGIRKGTPQLIKHSRVIDHAELESLEGLLTVEGVKYTTAPEIARQVVKILEKKKIIAPNKQPASQPCESAPDINIDQNVVSRYTERFPHIPANYGKDTAAIFDIVATESGAGNVITTVQPLIKAEVLYSVREEMALKLADIVFRRTDSGTSGCPAESELRQIAGIMAGELGWDEKIICKEVDEVISHYRHRLNIQI